MPHNRKEREKPIRQNYGFVVFADTEFSAFNAALIAVDAIAFGGSYSLEYIKHELGSFGQKVASEMTASGIDPLNEPIYAGTMTFQNWERPVPSVKIPLPNKFVPYVAARKRSVPQASPPPLQIQTEEDDMHVVLFNNNGTGYAFNGVHKVPLHNPQEHHNLQLMFNSGAAFPTYKWNTPGVQYPSNANTDAKKIEWWDNWIASLPES